jgi:hypothetical protein
VVVAPPSGTEQEALVRWRENLPQFAGPLEGLWPGAEDRELAVVVGCEVHTPGGTAEGPNEGSTHTSKRQREEEVPLRAFHIDDTASTTTTTEHERERGWNEEWLEEVAMGDRGIWRRAVPGLKIPVYVSPEIAWAFGYLGDPPAFDLQQWTTAALAWKHTMGVSFSSLERADEADCLLTLLVEINKTKQVRPAKENWRPYFYIVKKLMQLWITASPMGGTAIADVFLKTFDKAFRDGKIDMAALVCDAMTREPTTKSTPDPTETLNKLMEHLKQAPPRQNENTQSTYSRGRGRGRGRR